MAGPGRVLIDSGFFIALFNERDRHHASARELEEWLDFVPIVLPWPILYETVNTRLARRPENLAKFAAIVRLPATLLLDDSSLPGRFVRGGIGAKSGNGVAEPRRRRSLQRHRRRERTHIRDADVQRPGFSRCLPRERRRTARRRLKRRDSRRQPEPRAGPKGDKEAQSDDGTGIAAPAQPGRTRPPPMPRCARRWRRTGSTASSRPRTRASGTPASRTCAT